MKGTDYQYVVLIEELLLIALTYNGYMEALLRGRLKRFRVDCGAK